MVENLIKPLLILFVFLVVTENSERQFATAKYVPNVEVRTPSIRDLQEPEDRCLEKYFKYCQANYQCCSGTCVFVCW